MTIFFIFLIFIYLFIWLCRVLVAAHGVFIAACSLLTWAQSFSLVVVWALEQARVLSCPVAYGILVPQPGIEPESPELEGGVLTTGPPGKS